jgi:hypothetical protein
VYGTRRLQRQQQRCQASRWDEHVLGSVENHDSPLRLGVIQAFDG